MSNPSLPTIIQWFKSITTHDDAQGVQHHGLPPFRNRLWQRNYHDRIRAYVDANPASWFQDDGHPENSPVPPASLRHRFPIR